MSYSLHKEIMEASLIVEDVIINDSYHKLNEVMLLLENAYAFAKELEVHGYDSFVDLVNEYNKDAK